MKKISTVAIVLKNINHKDADKLYTVFSPDLGKVSFLAKGVRKISSKRKGSLDTFNYIQLSITQRDTGFNYLSEVVVKNSFGSIKEDYNLTKDAYYLSELVLRYTEEGDPDSSEMFSILLNSLKLLNAAPRINIPSKIVVLFFLLQFTKAVGYAIDFDKCVTCSTKFNSNWERVFVSQVKAGIVCADCASNTYATPVKPSDVLFARSALSKKLSNAASLSDDFIVFMERYVGEHLGQDLKTPIYL